MEWNFPFLATIPTATNASYVVVRKTFPSTHKFLNFTDLSCLIGLLPLNMCSNVLIRFMNIHTINILLALQPLPPHALLYRACVYPTLFFFTGTCWPSGQGLWRQPRKLVSHVRMRRLDFPFTTYSGWSWSRGCFHKVLSVQIKREQFMTRQFRMERHGRANV
jgi:hypothetical protein